MADDWHETTLGDVVSLIRGTTYKSALLEQPGPVLLGLASIQRNGGFRDDSLKTYGGESKPNQLLVPGDIFVSLKDVTQSADLLGAVARVPSHVASGRLTQDTVKLDFGKSAYPRSLLYWSLRSPQYRTYCRSHATGTTNLGLAREDFLAFKLPPPTKDALVVVELLESLDDKIELNRRTNETLEAMARALFKSWFVDFDGVAENHLVESELGLIPKGWRVGTLSDVLSLRNERTQASDEVAALPYVPIENIDAKNPFLSDWMSGEKANSSLILFKRGDILFGAMRPYFHKVCIAPFDGVTRTTVFTLKPIKPEVSAHALLLAYRSETVEWATSHSEGSTIPYAKWKNSLEKMPIVLPPEKMRIQFGNIVSPLIEKANANIEESRTLVALRDALLLKLISGELRVKDAEKQIAEAA